MTGASTPTPISRNATLTKLSAVRSPQSAVSSETPDQLGFRLPAEWEPHAATWLAWPHNLDTWPDQFTAIPPLYCTMVAALHTHEDVHICVNDAAAAEQVLGLLEQAGIDGGRVRFFLIPTNDAWARDHGPIFITRERLGQTEIALVDWIFNTWGGKYPPWDADDAVPQHVAAALSMPRFVPGIVLEGGSIDVNGCGTLLTTESCLLNPNRNPSLTRRDIEHRLKSYLGVRHIGWLGEGIVGDDTDGHIDDVARFVGPTTVVCAVEEDPTDVNYLPLQENFARLQGMHDQDGRRLTIVPLPLPGPVYAGQERLPASYANFYIANGVVLVPTYDHRNDRRALDVLQELFPSRRVVGIPCRDLVVGLGAIHCVTMQQPAADRIWRSEHKGEPEA